MPTFVFIPGYGGSGWVWSRVTAYLVEAGHEAIAVEAQQDAARVAGYGPFEWDRLGVEIDVIAGGHLLPLAQPRRVADYLLQNKQAG